MQAISDDVKIMLGQLQLHIAGETEHVVLIRLTAFYLASIYGHLRNAITNEEEEEIVNPDLKLLKELHDKVLEMQKTVVVGLGPDKQQWKGNLAILSNIYFDASQIAIKYDMIRYEIGQFSEFKNGT